MGLTIGKANYASNRIAMMLWGYRLSTFIRLRSLLGEHTQIIR